ncbi:MAG: FecR family protein, partial [Thermoanaerobaculales bacterium]|nr:FecR family protein [Thermoanaerobaculales bacterium]
EDEMTSLSYISYLERYATVQPASQEESLEAVINMPLVGGDRVDTAREARMEIVLADANLLWLDEYTTLSLDAVALSRDAEAERTVIFLADGTIIFEITEFALSQKPVRIDGRGATVYLDERGLYRIKALPSGGLRVEVLSGLAEAATSAGGVLIRAESSAEVGAGEVQRSEALVTRNDDFASWVEMRRQIPAGESAQHVDLRYSRQAAQLDNYGSWVYVDEINSWAWQPAVGGSWEPYRAGRWYWTSTGWAWISYEPWGWLPHHYGSWHFSVGFGWTWSWGNYWGPAWVNWAWWPGYVGWCPYGYYNNWWYGGGWYGGGHYPGYYPPYRPPYPGGGGGHAQPARRDAVPPRSAGNRVEGSTSQSRIGSDRAVDLSGRVRVASIDRRGWTAVRQEDFASPNLTRVARSGDRVMPTEGDQMGVVMTGPLTTRSPALGNPGSEIERVFREVGARNPTDVSAVMARDSSVNPETLSQLGRPTTYGDLSRRSADAAASSRRTEAPRLSTGAGSPFHSGSASLQSGSTSRLARPNAYRPTMYGGSSGTLSGTTGTGSSGGSRPLVAPRTSSGRVGGSRPVIVPGSNSSLYSRPTTSPSGSSSLRGSTSRSPSSIGSSPGRYSAPRTRSVGGSQSSGSSSRSSAGSSRSSAGSSRPSAGSSRPSGGSSRSSAGSSRPSGGSSKPNSSGAQKRQ